MIRVCSLGSGSGGNATVVECPEGRLLVDAGFTHRELLLRLARVGLEPAQLDGIFLTHEHGDHVGCTLTLMRRHGLPLWTSRGTWAALLGPAGWPAGIRPEQLHPVRDGEAHAVAGFVLHPFTVPHDAAEPLQLRLERGAQALGMLTDVGHASTHLITALQGCDALLLECNHEPALLAASAYPASLKARIGGPWGHLANGVAAQILRACLHPGLRHVIAAHLSQQTNRPALALAALASAWDGPPGATLHLADAQAGCGWIELG